MDMKSCFILCIHCCYGYEAEILSTNSIVYAAEDRALNLTCRINRTKTYDLIYFFKNEQDTAKDLLVYDGTLCYPETHFICDHTNQLFTYTLEAGSFLNGDYWRCRTDKMGIISEKVTIAVVEIFSLIAMTEPVGNITTIDVNLSGDFKCETSLGRPDAEIRWYKRLVNGTEIQLLNGSSSKVMHNGTKSWTKSTLQYTAIESDNGANIWCEGLLSQVLNNIPQKSREIQLNIRYPPAKEPQTNNNGFLTVQEGYNIEIKCYISGGNPVASLYWNCNNKNVSAIHTLNETTFLSLMSLQANSALNGESCYCCALHPLFVVKKVETKLNILYAPTIQRLQIQKGHAVDEYTSVTLQCGVDSNPVPDIQWTYSVTNIILQTDEHVYESNYTIPKTNCLQTGSYRCQASNVIDEILVKAQEEIILYVLCSVRLDQRYPEAPDTMYIIESNQLNITVFFVAYPKPTIGWTMRNYETGINSVVNFNNSYNIVEHSSTVYISQVSRKDYGVYTFTAFNTIGLQYMQSIAVMPPSPPGEPKDILVACEITSMIVTWLSGQNGGDTQSFRVAWLNTNTQQTAFSSAIFDSSQGKHRQYLVDSLIPDTLYIIYIEANNSAGSVRSVDANCTTRSVSYKSQSNNGLVIGFGGGIGSTMVLITVIGLVVIVFWKRRYSTKNKRKLYQSSHCGSSRQDVNVDQHIYNELQTFKRESRHQQEPSADRYEECGNVSDAAAYQNIENMKSGHTKEEKNMGVYDNMKI